MGVERSLCRKFRIKRGDTLPFKAWRGSRLTLAQFMGEVGFKVGAEVGVEKGVYSEVLCQSIPDLKLKCIDPWGAFHGRSAETNEEFYQQTINRLSKYGVEIIRKSSLEAVKDVPDLSLDFVYIDELHEFDPVMMDLIEWSKKVKPGGIVAGHDYSNNYHQYGVIPAVYAYTHAHNITSWYVTRDDRDPSFFWVKP